MYKVGDRVRVLWGGDNNNYLNKIGTVVRSNKNFYYIQVRLDNWESIGPAAESVPLKESEIELYTPEPSDSRIEKLREIKADALKTIQSYNNVVSAVEELIEMLEKVDG